MKWATGFMQMSVPREYRGITAREMLALPSTEPPIDPLADPLDEAFRELEREVYERERRKVCDARGSHGDTVFIWGSSGMTCLDCGAVL